MKKILITFTAIVVLSMIPAIIYGAGMNRLAKKTETKTTTASAVEGNTILPGIFIGPVDVSGLTEEAATARVEDYIQSLREQELTVGIGDAQETLSVADTGLSWSNKDVVADAAQIGRTGNILERFKEIRDVELETKAFPLEKTASRAVIETFVEEAVDKYEKPAVDMGLVLRDDGVFDITPSEIGLEIDERSSENAIYQYLVHEWEDGIPLISMKTEVLTPRGDSEELSKVRDVIGSAVTDYSSANASRWKNVENGATLINGTLLLPGDEFSALEKLTPFSFENGYEEASTFVNGREEDDIGGGICQVSSTLYIAALKAELEITERYNHSLRVFYVDPSMDATVADGAKDFRFRNNKDYPIYVAAYGDNGTLTIEIYGMETRDPDREIEFESVVIEEKEGEVSLEGTYDYKLGYVEQIAYAVKGMDAELWKVVYENGEEVSREQVNESHYKARGPVYLVGVSSNSDAASNAMWGAISSGSLDRVYEVIGG